MFVTQKGGEFHTILKLGGHSHFYNGAYASLPRSFVFSALAILSIV